MFWPLLGGFIAFVLVAMFLGWVMDTSRRAPGSRGPDLTPIGFTVAILGAVLGVVAAFPPAVQTPRLRGAAVHVANNTLLDLKDGWILIILAAAGLAALLGAYAAHSNRPLLGTAVAGLATLAIGIFDAIDIHIALVVHSTGQKFSVATSPGAGVILAIVGGVLMVVGAALSRSPS
jgi:hypothetical protein